MKDLLKKFGVTKEIELNYKEYVKAGGFLPRADFERLFLNTTKKTDLSKQYDKLSIKELREIAKAEGISSAGKKKELVEKLSKMQ